MKILITGASGFVGRNLIPYLQKASFDTIPFSLRDNWQDLFPEDTEAIIHLAGKAHDVQQTSDPAAYFTVNTDLTCALFDRFLESEARDFIYFSSVKAAADSVPDVLTETVLPAPATPYGISKQKAEAYLLGKLLPEGKRLLIVRPCMIHGPGNKGNLNLLYRFIAKGIPYPLAAFENKRSFLTVENLCWIIGQMLNDRSVASGIYNLADDQALSTNEVVKIIAGALRRKPRLMAIPRGIFHSLGKLGDVLKLPLNSERLKKLTENYVVANDKVKNALKIMQLPVSAAEGLRRTIESFENK